MPNVPQFKKPMPESPKNRAIYCFRPGVSEEDKQHDIEQIEQFIEYIRSKRRKGQQRESQ